MNGFRMSSSSRGSSHTRNESYANAAPPARVLVDGYASSQSRMNGVSYQGQPRGYGLYDTSDPVSVHLLMENALGDSESFQVLSPDDVDSIKKELSVLGNKIEATQRKLVMEMKVRDAASSMGRLQKPGMSNGAGRNAEEAEEAARKCDDLGMELWKLEKQEQQLARALLEHNAAILQMTHKGFLKNKSEVNGNGLPDEYEEFGDFAHYKPTELALDGFDLSLGGGGGGGGGGVDMQKQNEMIMEIGRRVEDLNGRIRDMMRESNIGQPGAGRSMSDDPTNPDILHEHFDLMENCLDSMKRQKGSDNASSEEAKAAETELQGLNFKLFQNLNRAGASLQEPPDVNGKSLTQQTKYLSNAFGSIMQQLDKSERFENVVSGLWAGLVSQQEVDDFSLQRFSAKVQEIQVKFSGLQEQKDVLSRQIQQQRELNDTADNTKDVKIQDLTDQLEEVRAELQNTEQETNSHLEKLSSAMEELDVAKAKIDQHAKEAKQGNERSAVDSQALKQERDVRESLEKQLEQTRGDLAAKTTEFKKADEAAKEMEAQFVRAQTELTIAKAELDSAHGSRAERAKEAAADPALQARIQKLETELKETIADYEAMTKSTIEYEKEREQFEGTIDQLREKVESLESQLSEEKVNSLGSAKSPSQSSDKGGTATSASVLRNEFRKMMKDQRAEHSKQLKAEMEERRKLEATVRQLRKDQLQPKK